MGGRRILALAAMIVAVMASAGWGQQGVERPQDEQAIRQAAKDYLSALARGDAKAAGQFWTADGDLVDPQGHSTPASKLLETLEADEQPRPQVRVKSSEIRFLTPDVALEDGTSEVASQADGPAEVTGRYLAVWVKHEGRWRLATLREMRLDAARGAASLAELDAMTGDWSGTSDDTTFEVSAAWNATRTYLERRLKSIRGGQEVFSGSQRIGWDPVSGSIKSWVFDSNGGRGEATWLRVPSGWVVQGTHVLPSGEQSSSISTYTFSSDDTLIWKSIVTLPNGRTLPEVEIQLRRQSAAE